MTDAAPDIKHFATYNGRMERSLIDKLFFVDKIDADAIVDFGCGDGVLLHQLSQWCPNTFLAGYDEDNTMLGLAEKRLANIGHKWELYSGWTRISGGLDFGSLLVPGLIAEVHDGGGKIAIVLSSVIHEVYHYSEVREIDSFWSRVFDSGFDYIVIRDMIPSRSVDRQSDINDVAKAYRRNLHTEELRDFENEWGSIENNRNLVHFLLKYRYRIPNWEREVKENYFPLYREELLARVPADYDIIYHEHYALPFLRRQIRNDFGIDLKDNTHLKLIAERAKIGQVNVGPVKEGRTK